MATNERKLLLGLKMYFWYSVWVQQHYSVPRGSAACHTGTHKGHGHARSSVLSRDWDIPRVGWLEAESWWNFCRERTGFHRFFSGCCRNSYTTVLDLTCTCCYQRMPLTPRLSPEGWSWFQPVFATSKLFHHPLHALVSAVSPARDKFCRQLSSKQTMENTNIQNCHKAYGVRLYLFHQKLMEQHLPSQRIHMH